MRQKRSEFAREWRIAMYKSDHDDTLATASGLKDVGNPPCNLACWGCQNVSTVSSVGHCLCDFVPPPLLKEQV